MDPVLWLKMHGKESDEFGTMIDSHLPPPKEQPSQTEGFMTAIKGDAERMRGQPSEPVLCKHNLELRHCPLCESAPKTTRKEWEEWVERMPSHSMSTRMEWEEKMKDWFLTMPIVPKE
jgi:hypothetical protein